MTKKRKVIHNEADRSPDLDYIDEEEMELGKTKKLKEKLKICQKEKEDYLLQAQRAQADLINFRKRQENALETALLLGKITVVKDILSVIDSVEAGAKKDKNIKEIQKQFESALKLHKIEKIKSIGEKFDYNLHEAVSQAESDKEEGTIIEEVQTGYMIEERVIRPSKVIVAK